ncbi:hypothetical protein E1B28_013152 [Marasmius oreades]|uniref:Uncharacterized protein n=1 Tax=Marasmius oreades TaxID=181124 RepID=A0A9P7RPZ5_9AGAR|nr:uncharacterized protein E1B28_013152 [Marasmius oreades]KAG7087171.1 hypothetical protein E1B28_013152 [Marasmius oreades]
MHTSFTLTTAASSTTKTMPLEHSTLAKTGSYIMTITPAITTSVSSGPDTSPSHSLPDNNQTTTQTSQTEPTHTIPDEPDMSQTPSNMLSLPTAQSPLPLPSPPRPNCQEELTCSRRRDAITLGAITGVFLLALVALAYLRYQRLETRRRLEEFRGRLFGEPPLPVRERSSLRINLNRLFDRSSRGGRSSCTTNSSSTWMIGRHSNGQPDGSARFV